MGGGDSTLTAAERNALIAELHADGGSIREIAELFDISAERVRQILARSKPAAGTGRSPKSGRAAGTGERVRLRIRNLGKAVLVSGQAYQDPKDALNEFVSNAADEYVECGRRGGRIELVLRRKGRRPVIAVDDTGRGMSPDRLREVARSLFESGKAGDDRTLGEKAIGILAFQQLGARCDIVSRAEGSDETWALRLERGSPNAQLAREKRRARAEPGTTVYVTELDPEVLRVLTQRKVVDYMRHRRAAALERGDYAIEVTEGRSGEVVTPERPEGIRVDLPARQTLWGRIEFSVYVAADSDRRRRVAVVGRAGTTVIDDLAELEDFDHEPWTSGQVSGLVMFEALQQTAGRRAVLRDREAFPIFRDAVGAVEPAVVRAVERVRREVDEGTAERLSDTVRKIFGRVLKELADLDNPMRAAVGSDPFEEGTLLGMTAGGAGPASPDVEPSDTPRTHEPEPTLDELRPAGSSDPKRGRGSSGSGEPARSRHLPTLAVDPEPGMARSRFDPATGTVLYNEHHADFLLVKDDESALLDYLAILVAKEYVVYNNPRSSSEDLAEEMVRMLVRVRRHLPKRR